MASLPSSRLPDAVVSPIQSHFVHFMSLTIFLSKNVHRMTHRAVVRYNRYNDPHRLATHGPSASNSDEHLACQRNPVRQTARSKNSENGDVRRSRSVWTGMGRYCGVAIAVTGAVAVFAGAKRGKGSRASSGSLLWSPRVFSIKRAWLSLGVNYLFVHCLSFISTLLLPFSIVWYSAPHPLFSTTIDTYRFTAHGPPGLPLFRPISRLGWIAPVRRYVASSRLSFHLC